MRDSIFIAGAGIIGSTIAWRLANRKTKVFLADKGFLGGEASSAGAGMLAPGAEVAAGGCLYEMSVRSHALYSSFVRELSRKTGQTIDYRRCGAVELALSREEAAALKERAAQQSALQIRSENLTLRRLARLVPAANLEPVVAARYYPSDGVVNPADVLSALRIACLDRGVALQERCTVHSIGPADDGRIRVETSAGSQLVSAVIIAAGAWTADIRVDFPDAAKLIPETFPVRGHLASCAMPASFLQPILRHGHTYLLQRASGELVAGTSQEEVGFDRRVDADTVAAIWSRAGALVPALADRKPDRSWIGFRPATPDLQPHVQRLGDLPVWIACGHFRNGILLAPITARMISAEISAS